MSVIQRAKRRAAARAPWRRAQEHEVLLGWFDEYAEIDIHHWLNLSVGVRRFR
jgi:hypothetical protein